MSNVLPPLREIHISEVPRLKSLPGTKIRTDADVEHWKSTPSFIDYTIFLRRLNESVVGHFLPWTPNTGHSEAVDRILGLLDDLDGWIDDIPPLKTPQRFGNLAFRAWGHRLEERSEEILATLLGDDHTLLSAYVKPYLLTSFGSFTRMDYGTGHETSFALFLLCLTLVRVIHPEPDEERALVLVIFLRYLRLCWKLQDVYRLEPAGSHGVWGLDDYCFLPYIFGSAQLREQKEIPVSGILHSPLPPTNLYSMAITRIRHVKTGPFHEHSSQLHSIAVGVPNWGKVNSGLFKMYEAEVVGKRVVVQHIPLGGLLEWEDVDGSPVSEFAPRMAAQPKGASQASASAPWASSTTYPPSLSGLSITPKLPLPLEDGLLRRSTPHTPATGSSWAGAK